MSPAGRGTYADRVSSEPGTPDDLAALPRAEFGDPGPLRDTLVTAILAGAKTATTSLLIDYEREGAELPRPGARFVVVDSADLPVAVIEVTGVRVMRLKDVDPDHAAAEGEAGVTVAEWRAAHERFWRSRGDVVVDDDTPVVLERFRLVVDLRRRLGRGDGTGRW
jgi:uncharacterized protein YhfF